VGQKDRPPLEGIDEVIDEQLADLLADHGELLDLDPPARRLALRSLLTSQVSADPVQASRVADHIDGLGPLSELMRDNLITDVLVNGPDEVWIERAGRLMRTGISFERDGLNALIDRVLGEAGTRADLTQPVADARLPDGSRIHVVMPPLAPFGPLVSIRRAATTPLRLEDLVRLGAMSHDLAEELSAAVVDRSTIVISGGTGTGKTTLLNALLSLVGEGERVVTVEETSELRPLCPHNVSLVTRRPNLEGEGGIDLASLVRAALRMRPDRLIVGEVRGSEALIALDAMLTGHEGSLLTVHSGSARGAIDRLALLAARGADHVEESALRRQLEAAIDLVVHLKREEDRRVVQEVLRL
jgi:pilus assembly protein CpaF